MYDKKGIDLLAIAIIQRAVDDYGKSPRLRGEIERFFLGEWFEAISPLDVSGEEIVKRLRKDR